VGRHDAAQAEVRNNKMLPVRSRSAIEDRMEGGGGKSKKGRGEDIVVAGIGSGTRFVTLHSSSILRA
jgi:hypothetical protein